MDICRLNDIYECNLFLTLRTQRPVTVDLLPTYFDFVEQSRLGEIIECATPDAPFDSYAWAALQPPIITDEEMEEGVGEIGIAASRWPTRRKGHRTYGFFTDLFTLFDRDPRKKEETPDVAVRFLLDQFFDLGFFLARECGGVLQDGYRWYNPSVDPARVAAHYWMHIDTLVEERYLADSNAALAQKKECEILNFRMV